jgi:hypothetical protein
MTNTPDELERAVERLTEDAKRLGPNSDSAVVRKADLRLILSERAELLDTVRRQGEALKLAREIFADMIRYGKVFSGEGPAPYGSYYIGEGALETLMRDEPRAALTTGEEK